MKPFQTLTALACPLPFSGVDTDQLIPARFMSRTRAEGYGDALLHDVRRDRNGALRADFPLNDPAMAGAAILVAGRNFGCGSSREAAVYALVDAGIGAVIAPSFGDIFASNAVNNGLLPALVSPEVGERLLAISSATPTRLVVSLEECTVVAGEDVSAFTIDPVWRKKLMNGWDDLDLTAQHESAIGEFQERDVAQRPWAAPRVPTA
ncbi:MAG: 3-isopropylmalate dehydratase small subunit [Pseudomonadota bacterium]